MSHWFVPNIIPNGRQRKFRTIWFASVWIYGNGRRWTIRRSHDVTTEDEVLGGIKRFAWTHKRTPPHTHSQRQYHKTSKRRQCNNSPVFYIWASSESMTYDHDIIPRLVELPPCLVRNGYLSQDFSWLEREFWYDENVLIDESSVSVHVCVNESVRIEYE